MDINGSLVASSDVTHTVRITQSHVSSTITAAPRTHYYNELRVAHELRVRKLRVVHELRVRGSFHEYGKCLHATQPLTTPFCSSSPIMPVNLAMRKGGGLGHGKCLHAAAPLDMRKGTPALKM